MPIQPTAIENLTDALNTWEGSLDYHRAQLDKLRLKREMIEADIQVQLWNCHFYGRHILRDTIALRIAQEALDRESAPHWIDEIIPMPDSINSSITTIHTDDSIATSTSTIALDNAGLTSIQSVTTIESGLNDLHKIGPVDMNAFYALDSKIQGLAKAARDRVVGKNPSMIITDDSLDNTFDKVETRWDSHYGSVKSIGFNDWPNRSVDTHEESLDQPRHTIESSNAVVNDLRNEYAAALDSDETHATFDAWLIQQYPYIAKDQAVWQKAIDSLDSPSIATSIPVTRSYTPDQVAETFAALDHVQSRFAKPLQYWTDQNYTLDDLDQVTFPIIGISLYSIKEPIESAQLKSESQSRFEAIKAEADKSSHFDSQIIDWTAIPAKG